MVNAHISWADLFPEPEDPLLPGSVRPLPEAAPVGDLEL